MIETSARVISCQDDYAIVETQTRAACDSCASGQSCGTSVLSGLFKRRHTRLKVNNPIHAEPGQQVVIGLREQALLTASFATYLLPLLGLIICAIVSQELALFWFGSTTELSSIVGGLLGLILGLALLKRFARERQNNPGFQAIILRREISQPVQMSFPSAK